MRQPPTFAPARLALLGADSPPSRPPGRGAVLDPRPTLIRVDTGNAVPEGSRENANELRID